MFEHGNSIGAAFILLVLGIGVCLGTIVWLINDFGRRIVPWFVLYVTIVLGLGYACEPLLWDSRKVEVDHTHAFDDLSSPFDSQRQAMPQQMAAVVQHKLREQFQASQQLALTCLFALLASGLLLRFVDRSERVEQWLVRRPSAARRLRYDPALSGVVLGGVAIAGLVAFSVAGAYVYFPKRQFCLERHALSRGRCEGLCSPGAAGRVNSMPGTMGSGRAAAPGRGVHPRLWSHSRAGEVR